MLPVGSFVVGMRPQHQRPCAMITGPTNRNAPTMGTEIASYRVKNYRLEIHLGEPRLNFDGSFDYGDFDPDYPIWSFIYLLDDNGEELDCLGSFETQTITEGVNWGLDEISRYVSEDMGTAVAA